MKAILIASLLLLATTVSGQLQVTIGVEPQSSLPGIEPSLRVTARNAGSTPVKVPELTALWVTTASGEGFFAVAGTRTARRTQYFPVESLEEGITVAPGASLDLTFWAASGTGAWFWNDQRLTVPGTYKLKLIVGSDIDDAFDAGRTHNPGVAPRPAPIPSNEVTYTVLEPTGENAAVWNRIKSFGEAWHQVLAAEIWQSHPSSAYAAYCVPQVPGVDYAAAIANYEAAIEKNPNRPTAEAYRLNIAHFELGLMHRAISADSIDTAVAASNRAGTVLTALASDAIDPRTRREAAEKLRTYVWTREQIQHMIDVNKGIGPKEVIPVASCVETRSGGKKFIWFGYANETRETLTVPIGAENKFTPPPFNRSQPTVFPPSLRQLAFAVAADTPHLTWHILKRQFQVKVSDVEPCPANLQELREQEEQFQH